MLFYTTVLFYVLTPGILLQVPANKSKMIVAAVHATIFALAIAALKFTEGFQTIGSKSGLPATCKQDMDCINEFICYKKENKCVAKKSLTSGQSCDRNELCKTGFCNFRTNKC